MSALGHLVHFIITLFVWPWVVVWIICAACSSSKPAQKTTNELLKQNNELLRKLNERNWK